MCNLFDPDIVLLTDAGTTYDIDCFTRLLSAILDRGDELIAVTARQRVMGPWLTREVEDPASYKGTMRSAWKFLQWWASPAPCQGYEFESTFMLNAMFNLLGALPVLPGPCQMLVWRYISRQGGPLDQYFDVLTPDPKHDGYVREGRVGVFLYMRFLPP